MLIGEQNSVEGNFVEEQNVFCGERFLRGRNFERENVFEKQNF